MTPERWQQVERLYQAALEREPSQRAAFLEEACAGDEELRQEVESLLAYEPQAKGFIEAPAPIRERTLKDPICRPTSDLA